MPIVRIRHGIIHLLTLRIQHLYRMSQAKEGKICPKLSPIGNGVRSLILFMLFIFLLLLNKLEVNKQFCFDVAREFATFDLNWNDISRLV